MVRRNQGSDIVFKLCQHGVERIRILIDRVAADGDCPFADNGGRVQPHHHPLRALVPALGEHRGVAGVLIFIDDSNGDGFVYLDPFEGVREAGLDARTLIALGYELGLEANLERAQEIIYEAVRAGMPLSEGARDFALALGLAPVALAAQAAESSTEPPRDENLVAPV